ncbi:hypothetical protein N9948_00430 [bacterium]|nr:hypothetical protein [bacterium]
MRLARGVYFSLLDVDKYLNVGNIMFEMNGVYTDIEYIPDSYLSEKYGFTKEELFEMISNEVEWEIYS